MRANTRPATVMVYWDYDTQWGADRSRSPGGRKSWGEVEFTATERLLELHASYQVPACFAVVASAALPGDRPYHDPAQIRQIHAAGHEIASHSLQHEWLPGLDRPRLLDVLSRSKTILEDCIGASVVSFVPPYNQPFDYWRRGSFSLSERRSGGRSRTDLLGLCIALHQAGYRTCRVSYRSAWLRLIEGAVGCRLDRPRAPANIAGITALRLNTAGGFGRSAATVLDTAIVTGGIVVVYGHPHSLWTPGDQHEDRVLEFLDRVRLLRAAGRIRIGQPRDLIPKDAACISV